MALVQGVRRDLSDGLHRPRHPDADGVSGVHGLHQLVVDLVAGVVLAHPDLLADDALLLGHALLGKPGLGHKGQQGAQVVLKALDALEVVARHGGGCVGVGVHPLGGHPLEGVSVLGVEHLVLQEVGHSLGGIHPFAVLPPEAQVHAAVPGGEKGELLAVLRAGVHVHVQPVGEDGMPDRLPQGGVIALNHGPRPPFPSGGIPCPA